MTNRLTPSIFAILLACSPQALIAQESDCRYLAERASEMERVAKDIRAEASEMEKLRRKTQWLGTAGVTGELMNAYNRALDAACGVAGKAPVLAKGCAVYKVGKFGVGVAAIAADGPDALSSRENLETLCNAGGAGTRTVCSAFESGQKFTSGDKTGGALAYAESKTRFIEAAAPDALNKGKIGKAGDVVAAAGDLKEAADSVRNAIDLSEENAGRDGMMESMSEDALARADQLTALAEEYRNKPCQLSDDDLLDIEETVNVAMQNADQEIADVSEFFDSSQSGVQNYLENRRLANQSYNERERLTGERSMAQTRAILANGLAAKAAQNARSANATSSPSTATSADTYDPAFHAIVPRGTQAGSAQCTEVCFDDLGTIVSGD